METDNHLHNKLNHERKIKWELTYTSYQNYNVCKGGSTDLYARWESIWTSRHCHGDETLSGRIQAAPTVDILPDKVIVKSFENHHQHRWVLPVHDERWAPARPFTFAFGIPETRTHSDGYTYCTHCTIQSSHLGNWLSVFPPG